MNVTGVMQEGPAGVPVDMPGVSGTAKNISETDGAGTDDVSAKCFYVFWISGQQEKFIPLQTGKLLASGINNVDLRFSPGVWLFRSGKIRCRD